MCGSSAPCYVRGLWWCCTSTTSTLPQFTPLHSFLYRAVDSKPDIAMDAVMQLMDRLSPEQQHECLQLLSSRGLSQKQF